MVNTFYYTHLLSLILHPGNLALPQQPILVVVRLESILQNSGLLVGYTIHRKDQAHTL